MSSAVSLWKGLLVELDRLALLAATDPENQAGASDVLHACQKVDTKIRALPAELPKATLKKLVLEMKVPLRLFSICSKAAGATLCAPRAVATLCTFLRHLSSRSGSLSGGSSIAAALRQQLHESGLLQQLPALMRAAAANLALIFEPRSGSNPSSKALVVQPHIANNISEHAIDVCRCWAFIWFDCVEDASPIQDAARLAHIAAIAPAALHLAHATLQFMCSNVQQLGPPQQGGGSSSSSSDNLQAYGDMHYALTCIKHAIRAADQAAQLLSGQGNLCVLQSDVYMRALTVSAVVGALSLLAQQHSAKSSSSRTGSSAGSSSSSRERAGQSQLEQLLQHEQQAREGWERGCSPAMLSLLSTPSTALLLEWLELEGSGLLWAAVCTSDVSAPQDMSALLLQFQQALERQTQQRQRNLTVQTSLLGILVLRAVGCAPLPLGAGLAPLCMSAFALVSAVPSGLLCDVLAVVSKAVYCTLPQPQDAAGSAAAAADTAGSGVGRLQSQWLTNIALVQLLCRFLQRSGLTAPPGSSTGAAAAAAAGGGVAACSTSQAPPAVSPELAQRVIACLQGYVRTLAATPELPGPELTLPALRALLSMCAGSPAEDSSSSSSSQRLSSPLVALAAIGGPGSGAQQHLYGLLCSLLKLSGSTAGRAEWGPDRLSDKLACSCQFVALSLAAQLLRVQPRTDATALNRQQPADSRAAAAAPGADSSSAGSGCHRSAAAGSGGDAVAYLPSLVLCGRFCLALSTQLQQELGWALLQLQDTLKWLHIQLQDTVNWLQDPAIHSQLSAAGLQPQQLAQAGLALLEACRAAINIQPEDGPEPPDPAAAALARRMRAVGEAFSAVAVPPLCNNPSCDNVSGRTELTLVSGQSCMCGGCLTSRFCGRDCQRAHWPAHRPVCQALKAAAAAAGGGQQAAAGQGL